MVFASGTDEHNKPDSAPGLAAFARAPLGRLWLVQLAAAVGSAALLVTFVSRNWSPVVGEAVQALPEGAAIRNRLLQWPTNATQRLAENRFLALVVDPGTPDMSGRVADLEITLCSNQVRAASLLG